MPVGHCVRLCQNVPGQLLCGLYSVPLAASVPCVALVTFSVILQFLVFSSCFDTFALDPPGPLFCTFPSVQWPNKPQLSCDPPVHHHLPFLPVPCHADVTLPPIISTQTLMRGAECDYINLLAGISGFALPSHL